MPDRALILNVDDYAPGRYARTVVLRTAGFDVAEATTGTESLSLASTVRPALVLLDVNLPDMNGHEVCRRLKSDPSTASTPVIHVSATNTRPRDRAQGLEAGADAYLTEPVDPRVLVATVEAMLRTRKALLEADAARAEAEAARAEAEAANRGKDDFIAVVSHELRGPLNAIFGWVRLMATGQLATRTTTEGLAAVERNVDALRRLVDDLSDASRIASDKLRIEPTPMQLEAVIHAALDAVRAVAASRDVAIHTTIDPRASSIVGDPNRLQQVVWNLLTNAVKFTPAGGRVELRLDDEGADVRITITDTGCGIAPDFLPHVFDRFTQAREGSGHAHRGLGLGLAIVRHLVELHGGRVSAASGGPGQGATFTVVLPKKEAPSRSASAPAYA